MNNPLIELVFIVVRVLDRVGIPYALGGSMASSVFGEPRATMDVDIAVKVGPELIDPLLAALSERFYVPEQSARTACAEGGSFNVLDVETGYKVDVFVVSEAPLDRRQIEGHVLLGHSHSPPCPGRHGPRARGRVLRTVPGIHRASAWSTRPRARHLPDVAAVLVASMVHAPPGASLCCTGVEEPSAYAIWNEPMKTRTFRHTAGTGQQPWMPSSTAARGTSSPA